MSASNIDYTNNFTVDAYTTINLSEEQQEALYQQFSSRYPSQDASRKNETIELPKEMWDELNSERVVKQRQTIYPRLYRRRLDKNSNYQQTVCGRPSGGKQVILNRYEDSDKLKIVGRSTAEIFEGLGAFMKSEDEETFLQIIKKVRRLSIFSFASGQEIDGEAKQLALAVLRLLHYVHLVALDNIVGILRVPFLAENKILPGINKTTALV